MASSPQSGVKSGKSFDEDREDEYFCLRPVNPPPSTFTNRSDDSDHNPDVIPDAFLGGECSGFVLFCFSGYLYFFLFGSRMKPFWDTEQYFF